MAKNESADSTKRTKRRVKSVATVREQRSQQSGKTQKRRPLRKLRGLVAAPFKRIAAWGFWQSPLWKPFRFIGKILSYVLFIGYIRNSFKELKLVTWPDWKQSWRLTWAVLVFSVFFGVIVAVVDFGLDKVFKQLILK